MNPQTIKLPCHFQTQEHVNIFFSEKNKLNNCIIESVKFTSYGKVLYDILTPENTILKEVDSAFLVKI